jgi:putative peptidoglycan lipid II flippase
VRGLAAAGLATVAGQQVALLVALNRGWAGPAGTVVQYALGQAVYLLPWAVLAVPLAVAAYPTLAAAWTERDDNRYAATLAPAARGVLLLSCLGAAGLVAVAGPAAHVLLDPPGTAPLAAAIVGFAPGLVGYALFALLSRALYARGAAAPAAVATLAGWAVAAVAAVGFAAALPPADRAFALALGNSVGMLVLGAALVAVVARRTRSAAPGPTRSAAPSGSGALAGLGRVGAVGALAGVLAAAAGLAVSAAMSAGPFPDLWAALSTGGTTGPSGATMDPAGGTPGALAAAAQGMLSGGVSVAVFIGVAYPLDRHDLRPLLAGLGRRLRPAGRRR